MLDRDIEVLFDDRSKERAGVKFKDADLLGIPFRVIIGDKTIENNEVEFKTRNGNIKKNIPIEGLIETLSTYIKDAILTERLDNK